MDIHPLRTSEDHAEAVREIERLWGAPLGTLDGDRLDVLATLVEKYEDEHFPIDVSDPIDILEYAFSDMGRSQKELGDLLGSRSRASEIMARKRPLTLDMIRKISDAWKIPIEILARPYLTVEERSRRPA